MIGKRNYPTKFRAQLTRAAMQGAILLAEDYNSNAAPAGAKRAGSHRAAASRSDYFSGSGQAGREGI